MEKKVEDVEKVKNKAQNEDKMPTKQNKNR